MRLIVKRIIEKLIGSGQIDSATAYELLGACQFLKAPYT